MQPIKPESTNRISFNTTLKSTEALKAILVIQVCHSHFWPLEALECVTSSCSKWDWSVHVFFHVTDIHMLCVSKFCNITIMSVLWLRIYYSANTDGWLSANTIQPKYWRNFLLKLFLAKNLTTDIGLFSLLYLRNFVKDLTKKKISTYYVSI